MSDTIDRQAAIEIVDRYDKSHMILKGKPMLGAASIVIELEALPSAQPEQRWIPCKERLPEEGQLVLTTIRGTDVISVEDGETLEDAIDRSRKIVRVSVGFIRSDGWYDVDGYPEIVTPRAWMPLPEPWKEGETE